ncbi:MAG TPA: hypothetical protein VH088_13575 [Terriglobales bacterium]|nr:hypothetical protein [Terriglobales bacterium]
MTPESKKKIQLALAIAIAVSAARAGYIVYQRHEEAKQETAKAAPVALKADYYITPRKLRAYDLKSAKQLTEQPVWTKEGYRYTYYTYDPAKKKSNFAESAGLLLPLQKLNVKDVVLDASPNFPDQKQLMAVFELDGKSFAVPIGSTKDGEFQIYSDAMLFIQDPHELYKHWPAEIWAAIDNHEVKPGMNELQTDFAIGVGMPEHGGDSSVRTLHYPNGGKPLVIVFRDGKATQITPGG